jgi:hypothetical protein
MRRPTVRTHTTPPSDARRGRSPTPITLALRLCLLAGLLLTCATGPISPAAAAATPSREAQITAVFLYNFAQFVNWPADAFPDAKSPLELGVVATDPGVADSLVAAVDGKSVAGHPLVVHRFAAPADARACHLLYVEGVPATEVERLVERFRKSPVLTVGNAPGFLTDGGVIRLFTEGNKMRFEVNLRAMEAARLKISSQLLKMSSNH